MRKSLGGAEEVGYYAVMARSWRRSMLGVVALLHWAGGAAISSPQRRPTAQELTLHRTRQAESDLEITGMVPRLGADSAGYLTYAQLQKLPQVTVAVRDDENFPQSKTARGLRVTGVPLDELVQALGVPPQADLIDALCSDDYRAHYPQSYLAAHHPLLGLTIEGQHPEAWAARAHAHDPSPYFITHARFVPSQQTLSHTEQPQVPDNVIRLNFTTAAATYGAIAPRGSHARDAQVQQGFAIARQNCFRCHSEGPYGGTKSGRSWKTLATWAREQPAFFAGYVHDPQASEPHAHMPGNPRYDKATLAALTAYFQTFAPETGRPVSAMHVPPRAQGR